MVFSLQGKFSGTANAETVIWCFHCTTNLYGVFVDDILVGLGVSLLIVHIPAQGFEKRVNKFPPKLGFVVLPGLISLAISVKPVDEFEYFFGDCHVLSRKNDMAFLL